MARQITATCEFFTSNSSEDGSTGVATPTREVDCEVPGRAMATAAPIEPDRHQQQDAGQHAGQLGGSAASSIPFCRTAMANRPRSVPATLPRPPKIDVPPSTTAVIADSS